VRSEKPIVRDEPAPEEPAGGGLLKRITGALQRAMLGEQSGKPDRE
jgi:hypothetical protein